MARFAVIVLGAMTLAGGGARSVLAARAAQAPATQAEHEEATRELIERAGAGDAKSQVELGLAYATGDGVAENDAEAVKWFRKAADQDDVRGERYLAEMYFRGRGVPTDNEEAAKWLRLAAGQDDAESEHNLAVMYLQGLGVTKSGAEAYKWMSKAATHELADAQVGLGEMFETGDGIRLDEAQAASWYRKAVDQGSREGANDLALLLMNAKDASLRNPKEAVELATKAAGKGDNAAYLDTLARAYFETNQYRQAIDTERRALKLAPGNEDYQKALAKYQAAVGDLP